MHLNKNEQVFKEDLKLLNQKSMPSMRQISNLTLEYETASMKTSKRNEFKIENVYSSRKQYAVQYGIAILATLAMFSSGMHLGWIGPTLHRLMSNSTQIPITGTEASWLAGSLQLGGILGPILGSISAHYFGRKTTILLNTVPSLITWIIISFASNVYHLCLAQFISGLGVLTAFTVLPMYIGEIALPKIRGILGTFIAVQFYVGFLLESIIVPYVSVTVNSIIGSIVPIFLICTFIWMPETPHYYLMKNQPAKAAKSLQTLTQKDFVDKQLEKLKFAIDCQRNEKVNIYQLFKKRNNQISFFVVLGIVTVHEFTGLAAVLFYAQIIFEQAKTSIDANLGGIILSAMGVIFLFGSTFFVDVWGRRPLSIISVLTTAVPLLMIGIYFHLKHLNYEFISSFSVIPIIGLILFKFTFSIGIGPLPSVCASEMFEMNFKPLASCLMCCYGSLIGFIVGKVFKLISDNYGAHHSFYFFTVCCLCGALYIYLVLPETKGKTLEDIQLGFEKHS